MGPMGMGYKRVGYIIMGGMGEGGREGGREERGGEEGGEGGLFDV